MYSSRVSVAFVCCVVVAVVVVVVVVIVARHRVTPPYLLAPRDAFCHPPPVLAALDVVRDSDAVRQGVRLPGTAAGGRGRDGAAARRGRAGGALVTVDIMSCHVMSCHLRQMSGRLSHWPSPSPPPHTGR